MAEMVEPFGLRPTGELEQRANVLLVDDNPANLLSLRAVLEELGQNLVEARSGEEALRELQAGEFSVVLLDVRMPGISGFETAALIRDQPRSRRTPIIFLTAYDIDRTKMEEGYSLGAVDFLVKPFSPVALKAKVAGFVELFLEKKDARREAEQLRMLVQGATDYAIFLLDPSGRIASWNLGAERIKQYRADEIIGRHFSQFYSQEAIDRGWPDYELKVAQAKGRFEDEGWRIRKDGSRFWANVIITALRDESGVLRGFSKITRDLTDRKRAEEIALRIAEEAAARRVAEEDARLIQQSEQELADFFENATVGMHWVGPDGIILRANRAELEMLGYSREEYVGLPIAKFHVDEEVICDILKRLKEGEKLEEYPARLRCKDGAVKDVLIDSSVLWKDGEFIHTRSFTRDVTERRLAEARIREQEQRTQTILESITDGFCALDHDWRFTYVNRQAEVLLELRRNELLGKSFWDVYADTVGTDVERHYRRAMADKIAIEFETYYPPHGRWYEVHTYPAQNGLSIYFKDVSQRRLAEGALRESEEKLRMLVDTIPQLAWMARPDGHIFWYNRRWYEYTGTTPEQMEGWGWQSKHDPDVLPSVLKRWQESLASGQPFDMVFPLRGADDKFRSFLTRVNPLRDRKNRIVYWFGTNTDVTEQIRAEEAVRRSEGQQRFLSDVSAAFVGSLHYQSILRQVAELTVPTLGDFCFFDVLADDGVLERVGWKHVDPAKAKLADRVRDFVPHADVENHPITQAIRTGNAEIIPDVTDEWLCGVALSPDHLQFLRDLEIASMLTVPMVVGTRRLGALTFCFSTSGRRHTSDDLRLAEEIARRAALTVENAKLYDALRDTDRRKDEFLATLAHELRNPLAPIRNSLQILKMPRVDAATAQQTRDVMERQVHHLVRLVDDLLDVSRVMRGKIELRKELVDLASVVARAVETAQPLIEVQAHELTITLPPESLLLDADPVRMAQVVGNLLTNAAKYTEASGRIWLTALREGDQVVLRIRDNGIGIAPEMLPKVFDLFVQVDHTAIRSQGGLGIGLTLVKNLVEMHNGTVRATSPGLGKGCEFVIHLPLSAETIDQPTAGSLEILSSQESSGLRLLVVDDNRDAAVSLSMLLRLKGYEVRVAHDGHSALEMLKTYRPVLIFLDIGMPGMDGYEVARRLRQHPELSNVVLAALTGWGQQEDRRRTTLAGFNHHLIKPPDPKALEAVLAELKRRD